MPWRNREKKVMRVVSFNFNNLLSKRNSRSRSWTTRVENMLLILHTIQPDILLAQEILRLSDLRFIAVRLRMRYDKHAWHAGGMAILTTFPIQRIVNKSIPHSYHNALIMVKSNGVWFSSIHLFSEEYKLCEDERYRETQWLLNTIQHVIQQDSCITGGDWNSNEKETQTCTLETCQRPSCDKQSLPATLIRNRRWHDAHKGSRQSTWIPSSKNTLERIDRIYYRGSRVRMRHAEIIGPERLRPHMSWPTGHDHRLIFADFIVV